MKSRPFKEVPLVTTFYWKKLEKIETSIKRWTQTVSTVHVCTPPVSQSEYAGGIFTE